MKILVTGSAGFIGSQTCRRLLDAGNDVIGIDNLNSYYDVRLKKARLDRIKDLSGFTDIRMDLEDKDGVADVFSDHRPEVVINLAAQAGVRYSLENPHAYINTNVVGFTNIIEGCRAVKSKHLIFASSSSVYGTNTEMPFSTNNPVDHPISLYAATKRTNELMAHVYSHLYGIPCTGLRFFTVYGPWGRPDMALFLFTKAILEGKPIDVFNEGKMQRSFTYIDDIVEGVIRLVDHVPAIDAGADAGQAKPSSSNSGPFRLFNIGSENAVSLLRYIELLEKSLGKKAIKNMLPMQPGDVPATVADTRELRAAVDYVPTTPVEEGIERFVEWYLEYYKA